MSSTTGRRSLSLSPLLFYSPRGRCRSLLPGFAPLGEGARDVPEEPRPVPGVDRDLHPEALGGAAGPLARGEPLRAAHQRAHIRAVAAVHGDPLAERDVADDLVAGDGRAAFREAN